ncbi:hypothetical protein DERP_004207 [Dermatophagoides pteronyssinus]|uniref:Uncharacterized protein n=1 Tax=Dermatophagoides pteronyssinus TaxID=6956 RepID=A0ABQ8J8I4_DERPT|nr:hypothetical protein DERP_004207 [Dermatophagoides pteronyssinus]
MNYNSLILFDSKNNLKLVLYETEYFVEYTKTFKNPANIIMISDDQTTAFALTHLLNDSMFSMETIFNDNNNNKEENLLFYLHINSKNPKQFQITKNYRNNKLSVDDENYSRKKMQEIFVQYEYRYGFMQTFVDDNDKFKEIVFLFSNKQEKNSII